MYTVGCSHGADATAWDTTILDPRVGMSNTASKQSFATIKCANQPKEGRSGGGLYTTDGYVAGVCDFADPSEHVGLYAVPEAIHKILDKNQLTALYKPPANGGDAMLASNRTKAKGSAGTKYRAQNPDESTGADAVTLPPPSMVGIKSPAWQPRSGEKAAPRTGRKADPGEMALAESRDSRVRPGEARQTELSIDPGPEERALESVEVPAEAPAPGRPVTNPTTATSKPQTSRWHRPQTILPDLAGSRPSPR